MQMRSCPLMKTWASFERLEMTRILRVIQQTQEKDFENECQEGITTQKLITQFRGCYSSSAVFRQGVVMFLTFSQMAVIARRGTPP